MVLEVLQSAEVIATMPRSHLQAECQLLRAREGSCRLERTMSARRDQRLTVVDLRDIRCQADGEREPEVLAHHFTQAGLTDASNGGERLATRRFTARPMSKRLGILARRSQL
jgi:hypothetical protein